MNLFKIVSSQYIPKRLCGVETALIGAGGAMTNLFSTAMANEANDDRNERNLQFSAKEAQKQRDWSKDEWTRQYQMQRDEWYNQLHAQSEAQWKQFLRQADYNSPQMQVQRLSESGLNPSALLGSQGSSGLVSAATGNLAAAPSPSVPTGGSVGGASASPSSPIPYQKFDISSLGSFLRDVASASKDNTMIQPLVKYMASQLIGQDLQNQWQSLNNDVLSRVKNARVQKEFNQLEESFIDLVLKRSIDENYNADTFLKQTESSLNIAKEKCDSETFKEIQFRVAHMLETFDMDMAVKKSQMKANEASASYNYALAKSENELRQFKIDHSKLINDFQKYQNDITSVDAFIAKFNSDEKLRANTAQLIEQAKREKLITDQLSIALEKAQKENDWYTFSVLAQPIVQLVCGYMSAVSHIGGAAVPFVLPR